MLTNCCLPTDTHKDNKDSTVSSHTGSWLAKLVLVAPSKLLHSMRAEARFPADIGQVTQITKKAYFLA